LPLLHDRSRYLVLYGGAGSGKSYFVAERYIYRILQEPMLNLLVVRAVANTNRDSTFALLKQIISKWGLSQLFRVNESDLRISCANGNSVIFKGLDDAEKLKSITFPRGELTDIWIEEASEIVEEDFNQLDVRLRGKGTQKQIVLSFNPIDVNHWLKRRFFDATPKNATTLHTTYRDNAHLDIEYIQLLESYRDTDPYYYQVYCLGQWGVYGKTVFDAQKVNERIAQLMEQEHAAGRFEYAYDGAKIDGIKWADDKQGHVKIFCKPVSGHPYVIGGDTAGEGSDYFTAQVLDNSTGEQVAVLKTQFDEGIYARDLYCLGKYYNNALLAPEANFSTYPIKELERLGYTNMYVRQGEDTYTGRLKQSFGFRTDKVTRPLIIAGLVEIMREHPELVNDVDTLYEMLTFVRNEKGRPEAQSGAHDDLIMALGIAHYIRPQQTFTISAAEGKKCRWHTSLIEDYWRADKEDRELMIQMYGQPINLNER